MQGLQNLGSTCAVNSLIQIICREPKLRNIVLDSNINDDTLFGNLREIIHLMYNENKSLAPGKFIGKLFKSLEGIFRLGEQIDIGELWTFLFDNIATEIQKIPALTFDLDYMNNSDVIKVATDTDLQLKYEYVCRKFNADKSSRWLESCQGFYLNIIKCKNCNNILHNFEPFTSILLDIPDTENQTTTITSMMRTFLKEETHNTGWKCDKCQQSEYIKTTKIWKMPDVLVIIIKRFNANGTKNIHPVSINKTICFKAGSILHHRNTEKTYIISSFAMHMGASGGGHYCAMCNIEDDYEKRKNYENIVLYDDINISKVEKGQFLNLLDNNREAYMIVYSTL